MDTHAHAQIASDAVVAGVASKVTYAGAGGSFLGFLMSSQSAVLFGILIGLAGFIVNLIFSYRRDQREKLKMQAYLATLSAEEQED